MSNTETSDRFSIDPASVAAARSHLREMARGIPTAEAAVEGFTDWQVIEAMERLWTAGTGTAEAETETETETEPPVSRPAPTAASSPARP